MHIMCTYLLEYNCLQHRIVDRYAQCKIAFKITALKGMHMTEMQFKLKHMFTERKMATFSTQENYYANVVMN